MAAKFSHSHNHFGCCASAAAACASMRISPIMDTVVVLAVSIFVCLLSLRVMGGIG